jgi:peptidoglycan/LPS O-acetylase OafA/YrhL
MDLVTGPPAKAAPEPPLPSNTMPDESPKSTYYPSLDGLRGMAACMVVYGHAGYFGWVPLLSGCATIGVLLFFFLSGFLMGDHYLPAPSSRLFNKSTLSYWTAFLFRRFLRVYPPYFFAPILGYLLLMPLMPPDFGEARQFESLSIAHELAKIATFKGPQGIYWTIQVELFFYMLYPFIISLCLLCRNTGGALLFVFCALTLAKYQAPQLGQWPGFTSIFVPGFLPPSWRRKREAC